MRRWGAAALDLAYVAAGRYDGFWERRLHAWDIAAGILIVKEAGGLVEPLNPGDNLLEDGNVDLRECSDFRTVRPRVEDCLTNSPYRDRCLNFVAIKDDYQPYDTF